VRREEGRSRVLTALALAAAATVAIYLINAPHQAFRIPSRVLGERRTVLEYLPASCQSSGQSYPVLVLLDATPRASIFGPSFYATAKRVNALGAPIPEMIVVGVTNTDRLRDMIPVPDTSFPPSPGMAGDFLRFITDELMPTVAARYRTSGFRILYGGSDAGLFALYALTSAPDAFEAVIASSPSLGRCPAFMASRVSELFHDHPALVKTLFLVYGADEGPAVSQRVPEFAALIERQRSGGFSLGVSRVADGGHVPKSGLEDGLRFTFSSPAPTSGR